MTKAKNYNALRRGLSVALIATAGAKAMAACTAPEPVEILPPVVQVEIDAGTEMSSSRIYLHGCFRKEGDAFYDTGPVGTLALAESINGRPITFTFTTLGTHEKETLNPHEVSALSVYTPEGGDWYSSPAGQGRPPENARCTQELPSADLLPPQYDGRFAQVRYDGANRAHAFYGPYDHTSYIDSSCGPVTLINDTRYKMAETSVANLGANSTQPLADNC